MSETSVLQNRNPEAGTRFDKSDNAFGLTGVDHVALPCLDMDRMYRFLTEVLGGEPFYMAGFDETDREMGRREHVFMRIGTTMFQFANPKDGIQKVGKDDLNSWPHWAFGMSAQALKDNVDRLRSLGIPVHGPVEHRGIDAVSAYFATPEGHKLEFVSYDAEAKDHSIGMAGQPNVGHTEWTKLFHDWPNV